MPLSYETYLNETKLYVFFFFYDYIDDRNENSRGDSIALDRKRKNMFYSKPIKKQKFTNITYTHSHKGNSPKRGIFRSKNFTTLVF